ncbi:hypothetical protein [Nonomuraea dietziae]|uniref:hypothetical protein n=1 Tax=Nonomuraea dietziae TaxID=65515 RepID=UPI0034192E86
MTVNRHDWERLGERLQARRKDLARAIDASWRYRKHFVDAHLLDQRTIGDLERGARSNYDPKTIQRAERAYRLRSGAIEGFLRGGGLAVEPLGEASQEEPNAESLTQALEEAQAMQRQMLAEIDALDGVPEEQREQMRQFALNQLEAATQSIRAALDLLASR